jgi:hypothetical protein
MPPSWRASAARPRLVSAGLTVTARVRGREAVAWPLASTRLPWSSLTVHVRIRPEGIWQRAGLPVRPNTDSDGVCTRITAGGAIGAVTVIAAGMS